MQFKRILSLLTIMGFFIASQAFSAEKYNIDTSHSEVEFSVKHMVISTVKGNFNDFSGTIMYDEENPANSSVDVTIQAASIDTDNTDRDNHLRNEDFFYVEEYPEITFKSTNVQKTDDGYIMTGDLTMRGVTKQVDIPFTITGKVVDPWGNIRIGAEGSLSVDRQEYGISWSKTMDAGGLVVSDKVGIELHIEAIAASE